MELGLNYIQISRPSTLDLILTKMMRGDKYDLEEIGFLIESDNITPEELAAAFKTARVPDENEILDLFQRAQPLVLEIAEKLAGGKGLPSRKAPPPAPDRQQHPWCDVHSGNTHCR